MFNSFFSLLKFGDIRSIDIYKIFFSNWSEGQEDELIIHFSFCGFNIIIAKGINHQLDPPILERFPFLIMPVFKQRFARVVVVKYGSILGYTKHVFCLLGRQPPRSTRVRSSAASDVYKRQVWNRAGLSQQLKIYSIMKNVR